MAWCASLRMWCRTPVLTQGRGCGVCIIPTLKRQIPMDPWGLLASPPYPISEFQIKEKACLTNRWTKSTEDSSGLHTGMHTCTYVSFLYYPEGGPPKSNLKSWNQEVILSNRLVFHRPSEWRLQWMCWSELSLNTRMDSLFTLHGVYWVRSLGWSSRWTRRNFWRTISLWLRATEHVSIR